MDIEIHKNNLKKYIEEDMTFKGPLKNISDFDKYCYNHCRFYVCENIKAIITNKAEEDK